MNRAELQRLDRKSIESKAMGFSIMLWMSIWVIIGVTGRFIYGDFYGFGAGFLIAPFISLFLMWLLFLTPRAKKKNIVEASWTKSSIRIFDPIINNHISIDLSLPHKAILIISKHEQQFLLRLDQTDPQKISQPDNNTRIDIIGQLPLALPLIPSGKAITLKGFLTAGEKSSRIKSIPYKLKDISNNQTVINSLLIFIEKHKHNCNNDLMIKKRDDIIKLSQRSLTLITPQKTITFSESEKFKIETLETSAESASNKIGENTRQILIALIPPSGINDSLIFEVNTLNLFENIIENRWSIPEDILYRKFTLYDDSVNTFIVTDILKKLIKASVPDSIVLELLIN
ncbi:MAG: hypothetical protein JXR91_12370 [Deltaproteobacteria bacterium]|nr:hypothetical protein [Deltaproteobacteria bacterium]